MAVTITNLGVSTGTTEQAPDIRDLTDATSYTIPSWDPPNDGIVVLAILNGQNTITDVNIDAVTGNGDVWQNLFSVEFSSGQRILTMFAARGSDLTTGSTVINFGTDTQLACYVSIFHITGADESTALSWVGAAESATGTGTSASHNWAASPSGAGSRPLYVVGHVANETITQPGSLTKIDDMNGAGPALGWITAYEDDGFTDPSDSFTWATSVAWGLLAMEIKEAPTTPKFALPGRRVPKALYGPAQVNDIEEQIYTVPAGIRTMVRSVHVSNPSGGVVEFTLAIGSAAVQGNRILDAQEIFADSYKRWFFQEWLNPGDTLEVFAGQSATLVLRVDGFERPAG